MSGALPLLPAASQLGAVAWNYRASDTSDFALTMPLHRWFSASLFLALACLVCAADADLPEWRNGTGTRFHARPVEALGPYALFGPEAKTNRLLKFRALSTDDCVRFHQAVAPRPPRADRWVEAQGVLTRDLLGCVRAVAEGNSAPDDLAALPEPELLLIYFH